MTSECEFLAISNSAEGHTYWTLVRKIWFHVHHRVLIVYTEQQLATPKLWRRMDNTLQELNLQIQYRPGKEILGDEIIWTNGDNRNG